MIYQNYYYTRDLKFVSGHASDSQTYAFDDLRDRMAEERFIGAVVIEMETGNSPKVSYKEGVLPVQLKLVKEVPEFHPLINYTEQDQ